MPTKGKKLDVCCASVISYGVIKSVSMCAAYALSYDRVKLTLTR